MIWPPSIWNELLGSYDITLSVERDGRAGRLIFNFNYSRGSPERAPPDYVHPCLLSAANAAAHDFQADQS